MSQWFINLDGQQEGPLELAAAQRRTTGRMDALVWRQGMSGWLPVSQVAEFQTANAQPPPAPGPMPPAVRSASVRPSRADEVDYLIHGAEMQFVEVELDPGESAVAEAGAMMYKDPQIRLNTVFGDGAGGQGQGFMDRLLGAGKRLVTGESLFMTVFTHEGGGKARVAFAAPFPGNIVPLSLAELGGKLICQKDSFLCAAKGVSIGVHFQRRILTGLFGGEGFIMQSLEGDGLVFVHAGGTVHTRDLGPGETLHVDTGCLVAYQAGMDFDIQQVGGIKSALFGGEGLFFAVVQGPGRVWMQSLPFSRLAGRMLACAPQTGGRQQGEGSLLGGLGGLLNGDNR